MAAPTWWHRKLTNDLLILHENGCGQPRTVLGWSVAKAQPHRPALQLSRLTYSWLGDSWSAEELAGALSRCVTGVLKDYSCLVAQMVAPEFILTLRIMFGSDHWYPIGTVPAGEALGTSSRGNLQAT